MLIRVMQSKTHNKETYLQERALLRTSIESLEHAAHREIFRVTDESVEALSEDVAKHINTEPKNRSQDSEHYFEQQLKALVATAVPMVDNEHTVVVTLHCDELELLVLDRYSKPCKRLGKRYQLAVKDVA